MIIEERIIDLTTLASSPVLPRLVRVAWANVGRGYRIHPGTWSWEQATVQVTLAGVGMAWCGGQATPIPLGRALVYHNRRQRDLTYGCAGDDGWEFLYLNLLGESATLMLGELSARRSAVVACDPAAAVWQEIRTLLPRTRRPTHRVWTLSQNTTLALRVLLAVSPGTTPQDHGQLTTPGDLLIERAMALVTPRLAERWTVTGWAEQLGVSREHLTRVFLAGVGVAPAMWLRRSRVSLAARRLRGGAAIAEVAHACGFRDAAHFSAVFRSHTGLTPRAFRACGGQPGW